MGKPLIVANWKMNPIALTEAERLFKDVKNGIKNIKNVEVVICPPFVCIQSLIKIGGNDLKLAAQNCFWEEKGAFTGEVSPKMLKDLGVEYVILGHSERRKYLGETDEMINKKIKTALKVGLKVIFCIGETEEDRKEGRTNEILNEQIKKGLNDISETENLTVAYEPVWAIGTGNSCDIKTAKATLDFIKKLINTPILYGGSVDSKNAAGYIKEAGFNGLLVGDASLKTEEFINLVKNSI